MNQKHSVIFGLIAIVLFSVSVHSEPYQEGLSDWPMYHYNAQHTGYNDKDSITLPFELLFKKRYYDVVTPLEPITVIGDRMIVTNQYYSQITSESTNDAIRCVDVNNGSVIWSHVFPMGTEDYLFDQACYYKGRLYIAEDNRHDLARIAVYDFETGELIRWWTYHSQWDEYLGSIAYKDKLFFPAGSYSGLACIDLITDEVWVARTTQWYHWSPAAHDTAVYLWLEEICSYDNSTGLQSYCVYPPNKIVSPISSRSKSAFYSIYRPSKVPVLDTTTNVAYLLNGDGFYAINYVTQDLIWYYRDGYIDSLRPVAPALCNGNIYAYISDALRAFIAGFDGMTGQELWRYELDTVTFYPPVISNGYIFAATENRTVAIDLETHEMVWEYPDGGFLTVANNKLFLASHTGYVCIFGQLELAVDEETDPTIPETYEISQNYPNPFNIETRIEFTLPERTFVEIEIYNVLGRKVTSLLGTALSAGPHSVSWDGTDYSGRTVASGTYLYRIVAGDHTSTKKMLLLK